MNDKTYRIYDSTLNVRSEVPRKADFVGNFDEYLLNSLKRTMKKAGYSFRQDVTVAKSIRKDYYAGSNGDVHFACDANACGVKIEFYENVVRDNKSGGRYHFDKMAKMPYLRRQKVNLIHQKLAARLELIGFTDSTPIKSDKAWAWVLQERAELMAFQGASFYENPTYWAYGNSEDADGKLITEGEIKYFRSYEGHLRRGHAWHHINNMWWVICSHDDVDNVAAFDLFDWDPSRHKRREARDPLGRMKSKLKKMVNSMQFEKSIGLRDAIVRMEPGFNYQHA